MSWNLSLTAPSKVQAKRAVTLQLPKAMLGQEIHAHDFPSVRQALDAAIDICAEGAVSISANGSVSADSPDHIRSVTMHIQVSTQAPHSQP
jgi:hypothetical protein